MIIIRLRYVDGTEGPVIKAPSKLTKILEVRKMASEAIDIAEDRIRLFYAGKQLENEYTVHDYQISSNNIVQLFISPEHFGQLSEAESSASDKENEHLAANNWESSDSDNNSKNSDTSSSLINATSLYYKPGELVDAKDAASSTWNEAKIVGIKSEKDKTPTTSIPNSPSKEGSLLHYSFELNDGLTYFVKFDADTEDSVPTELSIRDIRPRARTKVPFDDICVGQTYMVNYNIDEPLALGNWFDCIVTEKRSLRRGNVLEGLIYLGADEEPLQCTINQINEVFEVEKVVLIKGRDHSQNRLLMFGSPIKRSVQPNCDVCNDIPSRKCRSCSCFICGGKEYPEKQILCDECNDAYHTSCLDPPLTIVPDDDWYCPNCKVNSSEVVHAGEKLKLSKKRLNAPSAKSTRDWGRGMACAGVTKKCTIVPPNHFGAIPGVEVGMSWLLRTQVSETGVHRPPVGGIHARAAVGAFSIVVSGGYEDDIDNGDEFHYTGSGGRDLSANRRTNVQSSDQLLEQTNLGLALNCNAKVNTKEGAEAINWKKGKPVRVIRGSKSKSKYSPKEGYRYDGIYKVVKYWPEKGKAGFIVWRYLLHRDDPIPAPWTQEGKKRITEMGFELQRPLEVDAEIKIGVKRKAKNDPETARSDKKKSPPAYQLSEELSTLIHKDYKNEKLWVECLTLLTAGQFVFMEKLQEMFNCVVCQDLAAYPITTDCTHNMCKKCLVRSFKAEVYTCPVCRAELSKSYKMEVNEPLHNVLTILFPGYNVGR